MLRNVNLCTRGRGTRTCAKGPDVPLTIVRFCAAPSRVAARRDFKWSLVAGVQSTSAGFIVASCEFASERGKWDFLCEMFLARAPPTAPVYFLPSATREIRHLVYRENDIFLRRMQQVCLSRSGIWRLHPLSANFVVRESPSANVNSESRNRFSLECKETFNVQPSFNVKRISDEIQHFHLEIQSYFVAIILAPGDSST